MASAQCPPIRVGDRNLQPVGPLQILNARIFATSNEGTKTIKAPIDLIVIHMQAVTDHPDGLDGFTLHWTDSDGKIRDFFPADPEEDFEPPPASALFSPALDGTRRRRWNLIMPNAHIRRFIARSRTDSSGAFIGPADFSVDLVMEIRALAEA